jgi:hypothetical protein
VDAKLLKDAYAIAATRYNEARLAVFRELEAAHPGMNFDDIHRASSRAMELHLSALDFAPRVWGASISYEKAEASLIARFPEFPQQVCRSAMSAAHTRNR